MYTETNPTQTAQVMTPMNRYRCIHCTATTGEVARPGVETWGWYDSPQGHVGPFCSTVCADAWALLPSEDQLIRVFGSLDAAYFLGHLIESGRIERPVTQVAEYFIERESRDDGLMKCPTAKGTVTWCADCARVLIAWKRRSDAEVSNVP